VGITLLRAGRQSESGDRMTGKNSAIIGTQDIGSLQTIIDKIPVATLIIGPDGVFIDCNQATLRIFQAANRNEIIGKPPALLSPENQRNGKSSGTEAERYIKQALNSGSITFYWDHQTLKGVLFPAQVTLLTMEYEGKPCLMTTITDMTCQVCREENDSLIEDNPYAFLKINPDLTISGINPAFLHVSGYQRSEWMGRSLGEFKVIQRNGLTVKDAIEQRKTVSGTIIVEFPTGIKNLEYSYIPVFDSEGELRCIYDIFADLTGLVEKINESNSLIAENPASILTMDPKGKILAVNPAFEELSQIPKETLLSMQLQEFKVLDRQGLTFSDVLSSKQAARGRLVLDFGRVVKTLDFTYIPVLDANTMVRSVVAMYIDVSEQIAYVNEIETFIHDNPHAIITMNPDLTFTNVNPAFTKILGYSYEESMRMKLTDIRILEREGRTIKDALSSKKAESGRVIADTPLGIRHLDYVYIPILDKKGDIVRFLEVFSDLTAIRSLIQYLNKSVTQVQEQISSLARGDTRFSSSILEADEHSAAAREEFVKINKAVETARGAITRLVNDSKAIADAAIAGDLNFRSDPSVHEGEYRTIIDGMNRTLDSISAPIHESMKVADAYATYNFTVRFDPKIGIAGEWVQFVTSLNNIGIQVSQAISVILKNVSELVSSAEEVQASSQEILNGAQQVAMNAGKVSQNAEQGNDGIEQVLRAMEDLNVTVGAVSRKAESVSIASDEANTLAKQGIDLAKKSDEAMKDITYAAQEVDTIVTGINSQMDEIGKIVRLISDIANQTNLLALNAAIEAARAGEAGRGFAVVAAEVKSLAQDSRKSAENIEDLIGSLQARAKQATQAMEKSTLAVTEGSQALEQTLSAFNQIGHTIEDINKNTVEVASASEEQAASVEEVTASIQEVSDLVQNTSQEAGEAAAATEEASASIDDMTRTMNGVVKVIDNISNEMSKFKVS